jgi:hypothetical protein
MQHRIRQSLSRRSLLAGSAAIAGATALARSSAFAQQNAQLGAPPSVVTNPSRDLAAARTPITAPATFIRKPQRISSWGNVDYGFGGAFYSICVAAEEAFAKACNDPEIFISDDYLIAWAKKHNLHNGASALGGIKNMQTDGFLHVEKLYSDGVAWPIDYEDSAALRSAIFEGPVKLGVAADELVKACRSNGLFTNAPQTGWFAVGSPKQTGELNHCVSLCGYGTLSWLALQLGVQVPNGIDGEQQGYAMFTWGSIGIVDEPFLLAIARKDQTGEKQAYLRKPTTTTTLVTPVNLSVSQIASRGDPRVDSGGDPRIYYLATNNKTKEDAYNNVCELAWGNGSWKFRDVTTFAPGLPVLPGSALAVGIGANKELRVYYLAVALPGSPLGKVCELSWGGNQWNYRDIAAAAGDNPKLPYARPGPALTAIAVNKDLDPRVYYLSSDDNHPDKNNHVCELSWGNGGWHYNDITANSLGEPARAAASGSALAALVESDNLGPRVYYLDTDNHVHELVWVWSDGKWHHNGDITAASSGPAAVSGSPLMAIWIKGVPRVYYLAADHHVHEIAVADGWKHRDITDAGEGKSAVTGSPLTLTMAGELRRFLCIYYVAEDNHIHQLVWNRLVGGGGWSDSDISNGAPAVGMSALTACLGSDQSNPRVYYVAADKHVHELALGSGGWQHRDVTADSQSV